MLLSISENLSVKQPFRRDLTGLEVDMQAASRIQTTIALVL